jgi:hypothetical protein
MSFDHPASTDTSQTCGAEEYMWLLGESAPQQRTKR